MADEDDIFVELIRKTGTGTEMRGEFLAIGTVRCGDVIALSDAPDVHWTVYSIHRCVENADGTRDHSSCFDETH